MCEDKCRRITNNHTMFAMFESIIIKQNNAMLYITLYIHSVTDPVTYNGSKYHLMVSYNVRVFLYHNSANEYLH